MSRVKICGLTRTDDIKLCAALGVQWVGFVFYPPSPRALSVKQAVSLHNAVPPASAGGPLRVGLFVQPEEADIRRILTEVPLDILQLYTTAEKARTFKKTFALPVWLARGIRQKDDLPSPQDNTLDGFIIEAPAEKNDTRPGGLGRTFDWSLTQNWHSPRPWLLAGGLTPHNVQQAIIQSDAPAVDVSSGVEHSPGIKSEERVKEFVKKAHSEGCVEKKY